MKIYKSKISLLSLILLNIFFYEASSQMIGIDMGSEFFKVCITLPNQNKFHMVENLQSKIKTHSAIFLKGTDRIYETEAINKRLKNPKNSLSFLSLYLGLTKNSSFIEKYFEKYFYNYDYTFDNETLAINFKVKFITEEEKIVETNFPLEAIYGMLFRYIKVISEKYYKENFNENSNNKYYKEKSKIEYCYVTIPSFYSYKQRLSIIYGVSLTNMKLLGLINDNTAAAFYYFKRNFDIKSYNKKDNQEIYFIYINIGSSYTQMSLISYNKEEMKTIGDVWDKDLGGHLFTRNLVFKICEIVGIDKNKVDINLYNKIYPYAFKFKETLSANKEVHMNFVIDNKNYKGVLTREDFNEINKDDFNKIPKLLDDLFIKTNKTIKDISQIELIGGSIRVPEIQNIIKDYIGEENNELFGTHLNGDDSIAIGAAYAIRWRKKINEGIHYNISMELNSLNDTNMKVNRTIVFEKGTVSESKKKISIMTDQNLNMDIYEDNTKLMSCKFKKINHEVKDYLKGMAIYKNATYTKIPKVEFEFYISRLGIINLNAQLIFNLRTYIGLNITNKTGTIYNSLEYVEPLTKEEKQEINDMLNETLNPNTTYEERDLLNKKLKKGTFFDKDVPIKLDFKIIDYGPKSFTEENLKYWRKKLDFYDNREKEEVKIIELRNELESLIYEKQNFLESNDAKEFTKNTEYETLEKLISDTKNWFEDEGGFTRNISLIKDKIELIKEEFGKVDKRILVKKERDLAIEKFLVEIKNNQKKYIKEYKESKPWTEFFYDDEYLPTVQKMNDTLNEKINEQNKLKSYEEPVLHKEEIEKMHEEIIELFQKMINIPVPVHPPRYENIKLEDLYNFFDMI